MAKKDERIRENKIHENKTSRKHLTSSEKRKCIAAYLHEGTYLGAAQKTGFSVGTIKNVVKADPDFVNKYNKKREQEAQELFGALSAKTKKLLKFTDTFFDVLADPDLVRRLGIRDLDKLAKVFGIMVDKFVVINNKLGGNVGSEESEINIVITSRKSRVEDDDDDDN